MFRRWLNDKLMYTYNRVLIHPLFTSWWPSLTGGCSIALAVWRMWMYVTSCEVPYLVVQDSQIILPWKLSRVLRSTHKCAGESRVTLIPLARQSCCSSLQLTAVNLCAHLPPAQGLDTSKIYKRPISCARESRFVC
eukprot:364703-Chlamydomonas_euryale.AAC.4